jgi:hypothetical protein
MLAAKQAFDLIAAIAVEPRMSDLQPRLIQTLVMRLFGLDSE